MATKKKTADYPEEQKFTREQLMNSKTINLPRDALAVLLREGKTYTKDQATSLVNDFLQRKV